MIPTLFGLAECGDNGEPDPARVRIWGMETDERAILYWREDGSNQFGVFESADSAVQRFGPLFNLVLHRP